MVANLASFFFGLRPRGFKPPDFNVAEPLEERYGLIDIHVVALAGDTARKLCCKESKGFRWEARAIDHDIAIPWLFPASPLIEPNQIVVPYQFGGALNVLVTNEAACFLEVHSEFLEFVAIKVRWAMGRYAPIDELKRLPIGTPLTWVIGEGANETRHPAKLVEHLPNQIGILVRFLNKPQQKKRWSLITNLPVGESRGYVGKVRLELA